MHGKNGFTGHLGKIALQFIVLVFCVSFLGLADLGASGVSKWVDQNGKVHYGERPPENATVQDVDAAISVVGNEGNAKPSVVLYSTAWCGYCRKARAFLQRNNIPFREVDIEKSEQGNRRYKAMGGRGVPLLVVGKETVQGFNQAKYRRVFGL